MEKKRNNILENIRYFRNKENFTQEYVASKLGMKQAGYGLIEAGERGLQYEVLLQIAEILKRDVVEIITYPNEYVKKEEKEHNREDPVEAILQIKLQSDKKEQVLKLVFGENNLEILNK
ncbi:MAG: helix-turn-helix domain-containing protein [Prevotella sp.]|jgi:transcriptional regulator with XRE-family HTH domain|nr:helix-turn-helix domain-containing protein [Prevotella sp.]